jgi:hypothetical protein
MEGQHLHIRNRLIGITRKLIDVVSLLRKKGLACFSPWILARSPEYCGWPIVSSSAMGITWGPMAESRVAGAWQALHSALSRIAPNLTPAFLQQLYSKSPNSEESGQFLFLKGEFETALQ